MDASKPIHTLVLDAGAIIRNEPPVSTLLQQSQNLVTVPAIISEIKDATSRRKVETTLQPFLTLRTPNPSSIKFVTDFARRTGDLAVLSKPDIQIIALTYELECERNGGDWRLRRTPGQKTLNGKPPAKTNQAEAEEASTDDRKENGSQDGPTQQSAEIPRSEQILTGTEDESSAQPSSQHITDSNEPADNPQGDLSTAVSSLEIDEKPGSEKANSQASTVPQTPSTEEQEDSSSDSDGWITPSNLKKRQAEDESATSSTQTPEPATMQVAVLTTDYAMQNVMLQINLNLVSSSLRRVKQLKTFVLRCHACFQVTKEMSKQFCPKCGQPALTRVSCSTSANGEFKLHLKKNMQWNNRGDRYSIPKPVHGSANGRIKGGGKGGWGNDLILTEDQKEYQRAAGDAKKHKERSLMDEDYLPGILTGDRGRAGGRIKVGAGRNVNAKKR